MTNNSGDKIIKEQVGNMQVNFDKEAAWIRLQDRLESKDEKKPYFRIAWAAAAMLLIATTLWYSFRDTMEATVVKETSDVVTPIAKEQPVNEAITEEMIVTDVQPIKNEKKHSVVVKKQPKAVEVIQEVIPEPILVKEEQAPGPEPVKIVTAPKPKMRTVHINEIAHEQMIEERMNQSRYAVERNFLSPKQGYDPTPFKLNSPKKAEINDLEEEYRLLQN